MKKLFNVLVLVLALNFLAAAGGVAYLCNTAHVDHAKVAAIKEILFGSPTTQTALGTNSLPGAASQPTLRMDRLLAQAATRPAGEQVEFLQRKIDMQVLQLDERERQLNDLEAQVRLDRQQAQQEREALAQAKQKQQEELKEADKIKQDKGFTDTLKLYNSMSAKQAKQIFMTLDDATVIRYLGAMQASDAAKIVKEFKTDDEVKRIKLVLEMMRQGGSATQPAVGAQTAGAALPP
jgi:hypothetical protein